jgi:ankyrin repeat protein
MDGIPRELQDVGQWIWAQAATIKTLWSLIGMAVSVLGFVMGWRVWFRRSLEREGIAFNVDSFVKRAADGDSAPDVLRRFLRGGIKANRRDSAGHTALVTAAGAGQIATVTFLIRKRWLRRPRADVNLEDRHGTSPLMAAATGRRKEIFAILVAAGAKETEAVRAILELQAQEERVKELHVAVASGDIVHVEQRLGAMREHEIDIAGDDGRNALLIALENGHVKIVVRLLEAKGDPNARNKRHETALFVASRTGRTEIVSALLRFRANANEPARHGVTPLIIAAEGGYTAIVEALLGVEGIEVDAADKRGRTALFAAVLAGYQSIANKLREQGAVVGEREALLILAATRGDVKGVESLLAAGANPNVQGNGGRSALLGAAENGRTAIAALLLAAEPPANIEQRDDQNRTALLLAAAAGERELVAMLIGAHADINARRRDRSTALMDAVQAGHRGVVEELLTANALVNEVRSDGWSALMLAVEHRQRAIAELLLDAGADANVTSLKGESPLMLAMCSEYPAMVELLRARGAKIGEIEGQLFVAARRGDVARVQLLLADRSANLVDRHGWTPLLAAIRGGHREVVRLLVDKGAANVNLRGPSGTPLEWAVRCGALTIAEDLLAHHANVNEPGAGGKTPLLLACEHYHPKIAGLLLAKGADVDAADAEGRTPLLIARVEQRNGIVKRLQKHGASTGEVEARLLLSAHADDLAGLEKILPLKPKLETPNRGGETALLIACERAGAAFVDRLLEAGANPNVKSDAGKTPLTVAARRGNLPVLEALLARGAALHVTGAGDRPPLIMAAESGRLEVVQRLLRAKHNPNAHGHDQMTALMVAAEHGHTDVVTLLLDSGAEIDALGPGGRTALMFAAANGHRGTVQALLDRKAVVDTRDAGDSTALILACLAPHLDVARLLIERGADCDARDAAGNTPLNAAILGKHQHLETMLRSYGAVEGEKDIELIQAAAEGSIVRIDALIAAGVSLDKPPRGEDTALIAAIRERQTAAAQHLIIKGAGVNVVGRGNQTALIAAAQLGDVELVRALIGKAAIKKCEAVFERRTASVSTSDPDILTLLRDDCRALQRDDLVFITTRGRHYHGEGCTQVRRRVRGGALKLESALSQGLRPCRVCVPNQ